MPQRRFDWHERIKAVEREYWSTRIAVDRLSAQVTHDPGILGSGPRPRDLESADENLESEIHKSLPVNNLQVLSLIKDRFFASKDLRQLGANSRTGS